MATSEQTGLPTLSVFNSGKAALRNVCDVTLQSIPKLTELTLRSAFMGVKILRMENASMLETNDELLEKKKNTDILLKEQEEKRARRENNESDNRHGARAQAQNAGKL